MSQISSLPERLWRSRDLLRLTPFALDSEEGRSRERHRRLLLTTLASLTAKVVSVATALISVPLTLNYLGVERYGMWLTLSAFIAILSFADLGMGNGLLNRIAAANGADDRPAMRDYISSAFGMMAVISAAILALLWIAYPFVTWQRLFNVESPLAAREAGPAVAVFLCCFALSIPAAVVQKVQSGLQQGFSSSLWQCAGSVASLACIVAATRLELGLPWLVLSFVGAPLALTVTNALVFFARHRDIAPTPRAFSATSALSIARVGWFFLLLQIIGAISYSTDALIISQHMGSAAVPGFSVPERLFNLIGLGVTMALVPLWPAYGEAIGRADHAWVRRTFINSVRIAIAVAGGGAVLMVLLGPWLISLWVGGAVQAGLPLLLGLAVWKVVEASGNAVSMYLNGAHVIGFQVVVSGISCLVILALKVILVRAVGISGTVWATVIGYSLFTLLPYAVFMRRRLGPST